MDWKIERFNNGVICVTWPGASGIKSYILDAAKREEELGQELTVNEIIDLAKKLL